MSATAEATAIHPFHIDVSEEQLAELRRRIEATRWPSRELVDDRSQGVQLAALQALARFWTTDCREGRPLRGLGGPELFSTEIRAAFRGVAR